MALGVATAETGRAVADAKSDPNISTAPPIRAAAMAGKPVLVILLSLSVCLLDVCSAGMFIPGAERA